MDDEDAASELNFEEVDPDVFAQLDDELWLEATENAPPDLDSNSRALSAHEKSFRYAGVTSHVLVAACHQLEESLEYRVRGDPYPRGLFTTALIEALGECKEDNVMWSLTHVALFERIKDIMQSIFQENRAAFRRTQTPQLEGYYKDRLVLSTPAVPHRNHAIAPITEHTTRGAYVLPVGMLAGVQEQSVFEIYDYPGGTNRRMGQFRVAGLTESQTVFNPGRDLELGPDAYAVLCTPPIALPVEMVGEFPTLYSDKSFQADLVKRLGSHVPLNHFITPVRSGHTHKLRANYSRSQGVELQNTYGAVLRIRNPLQTPDALAKAAMFFHHLDQPNLSPLHNVNMFEIRVRELAEAPTTDWSSIDRNEVNVLVPRRDRAHIAMHPTGGCTIPAPQDPNAMFGLQIINRGAYNFFIYVFYFDPSEFHMTISLNA
jgi:hypothetical protein